MRHLPAAMIRARLLMDVIVLPLSFNPPAYYSIIAVTLFSAGLLSDVFDGIIAQRPGMATITLRRLDSAIGQVFRLMVTAAAILHCPVLFPCIIIGIIIRAEVTGILLLLRTWASDVPGICHAVLLRRGTIPSAEAGFLTAK